MPTKIWPKYGTETVQEVSAFSFTHDQAELLLKELAPREGNPKEIISARLVRCARQYLWRRNQYREKLTVAEENAVMNDIAQSAEERGKGLDSLEIKLRNLDMDTKWQLSKSRASHLDRLNDEIAHVADELAHLAQTAKQALHAGKEKSGPRMRVAVPRTVAELAIIYEEFTGKPLSHNPKVLTHYDGRPHSPAGRFIVAFFEIVDPDLPQTSLST